MINARHAIYGLLLMLNGLVPARSCLADIINIVSSNNPSSVWDLANTSGNLRAAANAILGGSYNGGSDSVHFSHVDRNDSVALQTALSNGDIYLVNSASLTAAENANLYAFLTNGGGILSYGNNGFTWVNDLFGGTLSGPIGREHFGGVILQAGSPFMSGAGGTRSPGTSTLNSWGQDVTSASVINSGGVVALQTNGTTDAFAATWNLTTGGRIVAFGDEEFFKNTGTGGDSRWNATHQVYTLNAVEFLSNAQAAAVPEVSSFVALASLSAMLLLNQRKGKR